MRVRQFTITEPLNSWGLKLSFSIIAILIVTPIEANNPPWISKDNYARVTVTWRNNKYPLLKETLTITSTGENKCDEAIPVFLTKEPKRGYSFHQRLDSPVLLGIDQFVDGKLFISKFYYRCNGVYFRN